MSLELGLLGVCFFCISSCLSGFCLAQGGYLLCLGLRFLLLVGRFVSLCFLALFLGVFCSVVFIFGMHILISQLGIGASLHVGFPPFLDRIFRRGRAMMVVISRPSGHMISFILHSFFAIFQITVLC